MFYAPLLLVKHPRFILKRLNALKIFFHRPLLYGMLAHFLKENHHRNELKQQTRLKHSDDIYPKSDRKYHIY